MLQIKLDGCDLPVVRIGLVHGCDVGRFAQVGIVGTTNHVGIETAAILRRAQHMAPHIPERKYAVIPLRGIVYLLAFRDELSSFTNYSFEWFDRVVLQQGSAIVAKADGDLVLSEPVEADAVD